MLSHRSFAAWRWQRFRGVVLLQKSQRQRSGELAAGAKYSSFLAPAPPGYGPEMTPEVAAPPLARGWTLGNS
jgi:hypothetical protein